MTSRDFLHDLSYIFCDRLRSCLVSFVYVVCAPTSYHIVCEDIIYAPCAFYPLVTGVSLDEVRLWLISKGRSPEVVQAQRTFE